MLDAGRTGLSRRALLRAAAAGCLASAASRGAFGQAGSALKIGVIGSGHIGSTVGGLWVKAGHPVMFSSRHPEELAALVQGIGALATTGTVAEAIAYGDVVFVAVPYGAYPQLGRDHASALAGKVVLDAGNAVAARDGDIINEVRAQGIGVTSARYFPGARVVRAFNTLGYRILAAQADRAGDRMAIPLAGDDKDALTVASTLVHDAGFDPVIIGKLVRAADFAQGGPLYGQQLTAVEMRQRAEAIK
jgi:predicted dinucleotide-binding enzyme